MIFHEILKNPQCGPVTRSEVSVERASSLMGNLFLSDRRRRFGPEGMSHDSGSSRMMHGDRLRHCMHSFRGVAALLGMLNKCASNMAAVNIDSGFKSGYVAGRIARRKVGCS